MGWGVVCGEGCSVWGGVECVGFHTSEEDVACDGSR